MGQGSQGGMVSVPVGLWWGRSPCSWGEKRGKKKGTGRVGNTSAKKSAESAAESWPELPTLITGNNTEPSQF